VGGLYVIRTTASSSKSLSSLGKKEGDHTRPCGRKEKGGGKEKAHRRSLRCVRFKRLNDTEKKHAGEFSPEASDGQSRLLVQEQRERGRVEQLDASNKKTDDEKIESLKEVKREREELQNAGLVRVSSG